MARASNSSLPWLQNIKTIYLEENQLVGTLPESWSDLINVSQSTTRLQLSAGLIHPTAYKSYNNCKWCTMVVCLADWVFLLVQLDSLALHENRLGGTLPASWSKLTSVSYEHCTILPCIAVAQVWTCVSNPMATGHAQLGCACFLLRKCAHVAQTSWLTAQTSGKPNALQWAHYSWHTKTMQASSGCLWYVIASFSASQD